MACNATGASYCVWVMYTPEGKRKGNWTCFHCGRRRRARKKVTRGK